MRNLLWITILTLATLAFRCPDKPLPAADDADWKGVRPAGFVETTDNGVRVSAATSIDKAILPEIDLGLADLFTIAKAPPYSYSFTDDLHKWHVWLMPANHDKCIDPGFTLRVTSPLYPVGWDQYPEIDKDPREGFVLLCVAGFMEREGNEPGMVIVANVSSIRTVTRYEGEHNVLFESDPEKFKATSNNHHHPLLPRADGSQIINSDTPDGRSASVRLDDLFVLPDAYRDLGKTPIHILIRK